MGDEAIVSVSTPPHALVPAPTSEADELRARLVAQLRQANLLRDEAIERALLRVPRHLFLPQVPLAQAYADLAVPTRWENGMPVSSASQPAIVALMLEQMQLAPGMRVLEIGAGTGYNAALLAELVGPSGQVTTIDIDPEIADEARANLAVAGCSAVRVLASDGYEGWDAGAPYDRVVLTVSASDISPAWFEQLADDGLLVLPLSLRATEASVAFRKRWGRLTSESITPCAFVRLRGAAAGIEHWATLPGEWRLSGESAREHADAIAALLAKRPRRRLWLPPQQSFAHYLGLRGLSLVALFPDPQQRRRRPRLRLGLYLGDERGGPSLALFGLGQPFLLGYGTPAAERMLQDEAARFKDVELAPVESWSVVGYPHSGVDGTPSASAGAVRLARHHFTFDILPGVALTDV
jgi:protein-L-isoaspartate(D-aspartate) O-methyltransferase